MYSTCRRRRKPKVILNIHYYYNELYIHAARCVFAMIYNDNRVFVCAASSRYNRCDAACNLGKSLQFMGKKHASAIHGTRDH